MGSASYERGPKTGQGRTPGRSSGGSGRRPSPPPGPRGGFSRGPAGPPPHHRHRSSGGCLSSILTMLLSIGLCATLIGMCRIKK